MGLIDSALDAFRLKETIIYKENSDLQLKFDALNKLNRSIKKIKYWNVCFKRY